MREVAETFNACPTALDEDMAWHPALSCGECRLRKVWPLGAEPYDQDWQHYEATDSDSGSLAETSSSSDQAWDIQMEQEASMLLNVSSD
jgi:hypothetical protein